MKMSVFSPNNSYQMAPGIFEFNDCAHITDCSKTLGYSLKNVHATVQKFKEEQ